MQFAQNESKLGFLNLFFAEVHKTKKKLWDRKKQAKMAYFFSLVLVSPTFATRASSQLILHTQQVGMVKKDEYVCRLNLGGGGAGSMH